MTQNILAFRKRSNYNVIMRAKIVKIGNSQGIRIPKLLLEQSGLTGEVDLSVQKGRIVISRVAEPRAGWEESFRAMAAAKDDRLHLKNAPAPEWDETDWEWE